MAAVDPSQQSPGPAVLFKKRGAKKNTIRKREATPPSSDGSADESEFTDEDGRQVKRRRKAGGVVAAASNIRSRPAPSKPDDSEFQADRSSTIQLTSDATKHSNWFDSDDKLLDTAASRSVDKATESSDGVYRGADKYQSYIQKNPNAPTKTVGPMRAPANVRTITVTDYAPDVCKDYKQTGFCGFGDSCKFLHAREDYKQGWQLDRDWETVAKGNKPGAGGRTAASRAATDEHREGESEDDEALLEGIPFACIICRETYKHPIVTKCGHYFCEACALKRYKKTPNCAACGAGTGGVFNGARNLKKLLDRKKEREAQQRELTTNENREE